MQALGAQNIELPGGRLNIGNREYILKTRGEVHSAAELGAIIIHAQGGTRCASATSAASRTAKRRRAPSPRSRACSAVSLVVRKQSGSNTVADGARRCAEAIEKLRKRLPKRVVTLKVPLDNSTFIEHSINDVQDRPAPRRHPRRGDRAVLSARLARDTFISALAIPTSVDRHLRLRRRDGLHLQQHDDARAVLIDRDLWSMTRSS
jgi:HAE1 family hydrophobic/amphiphilic exporter-1